MRRAAENDSTNESLNASSEKRLVNFKMKEEYEDSLNRLIW